MTSDAKIGLLLGLVFIFIIAFVINGLPRFRNTTNGSELTTNMVSSQNDTLGIGDKERDVQNLIDWSQPPVQEQQPSTETMQLPLEDDEGIRYQRTLPEIIPYSPITETAEEPESAPIKPTESTLVKLFDPPASQPPREEKAEIKKSRPTQRISPKVYTVSDGDSLAKIAKKIYGTEEGNKRANIMRIFELNRGLLTSPDDLQIGQKLIIPPLIKSGMARSVTDEKNPSSFFEKVESIGRRILRSDKQNPTPSRPANTQGSTAAGQYIVKEGDSLWKIAAQKLGDGSRYPEIVKLNADFLKDENSLRVGAKLKIPAR